MRGALLLLTVLAACGPVTREQAEANCARRADAAQRPSGFVQIGAGSGGGVFTGVGLSASADYLMRRDPETVYRTCVYNTSGEMPLRPYTRLP
ncbi:hypothetical protein [Falsirhodobacter halotolerans]|uniref:hypothetical protein n=1 Tax=Falsirhodobacter halotolerans TaxID=1146892 RepID=UPI001FD4B5E8|nr:hypothetical protein [Falsirhodobacter halotolerans]MCJ8140448.1 hypothetical protein [Falsirhodobacter halotolerans]